MQSMVQEYNAEKQQFWVNIRIFGVLATIDFQVESRFSHNVEKKTCVFAKECCNFAVCVLAEASTLLSQQAHYT